MKKQAKKQEATRKESRNPEEKALKQPVKKAAKKTTKAPSAKQQRKLGGFTKLYVKSRSACRVTFRLPREAAFDATHVSLVGEFNGWDGEATPMKKLKSGDFTTTIELDSGKDYRFRYLIEGDRWENDWRADRYEPNPHGGDDSIVSV
jgi:1,4-alpha-glucan branching enzyme